jgi:hypothetical protein
VCALRILATCIAVGWSIMREAWQRTVGDPGRHAENSWLQNKAAATLACLVRHEIPTQNP